MNQLSRYLVICIVVALATTGCSKNSNHAVVRGTVTIDGKPLESGFVAFYPLDGKGKTAGARIFKGSYETKQDVPIVNMRVEIVSRTATSPEGTHPDKIVVADIVPKKYNVDSKMTLEVKQGVNEQNYDLTSK
jgi:hypothetical protein